jgi:hypothetical protein
MTTAFHLNQMIVARPPMAFGFDAAGPHVAIHHGGSYARQVKVDPTPAYAHDGRLARHELDGLQQVAPLPLPIAIWLLDQETDGRTNGTYYDDFAYGTEPVDGSYPPVGIIVLAGKRIPIHPAMTRYLVSHEYGHGVMYHLARVRGLKSHELLVDYRDRCRPTTSHDYGCGKWHANVGELFANDFRILVARREEEFWPHDGFARPETVPAIVAYWQDACRELGWLDARSLADAQVAECRA